MEETVNTIPSSPVTPPIKSETSQDTRTLVTVLLLIFVFPIGFFVMWFWSKWKVWVKVIISIPSIIITLVVISTILLAAVNPSAQLEKAKQSASPSSVDTSYEEAFKTSYLKSCLSTSSNQKAYCECTLEYLSETGVGFNNTTKILATLPDAIQSCKSLIK